MEKKTYSRLRDVRLRHGVNENFALLGCYAA